MCVIFLALHATYLKILIKFWRLKRRKSKRLREQRGLAESEAPNCFKSIFYFCNNPRKSESSEQIQDGSPQDSHDNHSGEWLILFSDYHLSLLYLPII
jgi:hypothetical protein